MQTHELETYDRESQMRGSCFLQQLTTAGEPQAPVQPYGQRLTVVNCASEEVKSNC